MSPKHVLICRTDNIGDVTLTLPLAHMLKSRDPQLRIGFICRGYAAGVVRLCDAVDDVLEVEQLDDPVAALANSGADTIIFAKPDRRLAMAAWRAGIAQRVGTSHRLFHWLYCNRLAHFSRARSSLHEAQHNFALLRPLGIAMMPDLSQLAALALLATPPLAAALAPPAGQFNLIFHTKSNGNGREWPISHFTALARLLGEHPDIRIWLTGSVDEGRWLAQNASVLLGLPQVKNICGHLSLAQLSAFIAASDGLIACGTGPLHLSAGLGQNTLGLFPPLPPIHPTRWAPLGPRAEYLCQATQCKGCADATQCECMRQITPGRVEEVVLRWRAAVAC